MINIRKLEAELWESADLLRARVKADVESILYARARAYFPALCVQPL